MTDRPQSRGEEIANAVSHGAGALLAMVALPVQLVNAMVDHRPGVELFALTLFVLGGTACHMVAVMGWA
jgi:hemolysin III